MMCGVGVGVGEEVGSMRVAERERGIGKAFGMWLEARVGGEMRKGSRRMEMAVMRILEVGGGR